VDRLRRGLLVLAIRSFRSLLLDGKRI